MVRQSVDLEPSGGCHAGSRVRRSRDIRLQAALIDVGDAPLCRRHPPPELPRRLPQAAAEQSRWPGVEARVALRGPAANNDEDRSHFGVGGYFAPHYSSLLGHGFDSWAALSMRACFCPLVWNLPGASIVGRRWAGLEAEPTKISHTSADTDSADYYFRPLDDVGGWAQLKEKLTERLEFNAAFGMDNAFANELRRYAVPGGAMYQNLARNRTYTGNVIYSPSAYLLFSLEYRHLESFPVVGLAGGKQYHRPGGGIQILMRKRRFGEWMLCAATLASGDSARSESPCDEVHQPSCVFASSPHYRESIALFQPSSGWSRWQERTFFLSLLTAITHCCRRTARSSLTCR